MAPRPGIERFFEDALDVGYRGDTSLHRRPPTFVDRVDIDHPDGGANQRALSVSREAGLEIASASGLSAERAERIVLKSIKRVLHQHVRELRSR